MSSPEKEISEYLLTDSREGQGCVINQKIAGKGGFIPARMNFKRPFICAASQHQIFIQDHTYMIFALFFVHIYGASFLCPVTMSVENLNLSAVMFCFEQCAITLF